MSELVRVTRVGKSFTLHNQGGVCLPVLGGVSFSVAAGECLVLHGPSGAGKSTLLRLLYGNYKCSEGMIEIHHQGRWVDIASADPRDVLDVRRQTLSYVSQFLRVIPRVSALDIVKEPLVTRGMAADLASKRAADMLARLNIPERLWSLAPATFSGGEQQRVALARAFVTEPRILFCDEPTGNLDGATAAVVTELIFELNLEKGTTLVLVTHDAELAKRCGRTLRLRGGEIVAAD